MIKRVELERHLRAHGASLVRQGGKHSIWIAPNAQRPVTVPRHRDIPRTTALAICKQLGVPPVA